MQGSSGLDFIPQQLTCCPTMTQSLAVFALTGKQLAFRLLLNLPAAESKPPLWEPPSHVSLLLSSCSAHLSIWMGKIKAKAAATEVIQQMFLPDTFPERCSRSANHLMTAHKSPCSRFGQTGSSRHCLIPRFAFHSGFTKFSMTGDLTTHIVPSLAPTPCLWPTIFCIPLWQAFPPHFTNRSSSSSDVGCQFFRPLAKLLTSMW